MGRIWNQAQLSLTALIGDISVDALEMAFDSKRRQ